MNKKTHNWPLVSLGEVLVPVTRPERVDPAETYRILGAHWYALGLYVKDVASGSEVRARELYRVGKGDFVYNRLFGWKGAFAIATDANDGCYVSNEFPCFQVRRDRADGQYIWKYFSRSSVWDEVLSLSTGGTPTSRNRLKENELLAMTIPLPSPGEQQRIVARIEELSGKVEEARKLRQQAVEEAEALSYAVLRRTRQQLLASSHTKARLGSVTKVTSGGTPSRDNLAFWNGDIPWVKTGELVDSDISKTEEHITQLGVEKSSAKVFPPQTVLVALYGQGQTRGRTGRLLIPATTNQACCAILPNPEKFEARYIQFWLRSLYVELREEAQGGAQPNWNGALIKALEVALPPLPEQRRIVAELDELQGKTDSLKALQSETSAELDALMPSILDKAFRGEL